DTSRPMEPRAQELAMLDRCLLAAAGAASPENKAEADLFRCAAMLLTTHHPVAAGRLWVAHQTYYASHPGVPASYAELRQQLGLAEPGRLRDMLSHRMRERQHAA